MSNYSSGKRIAKNTLALYFRQILVMIVSLYTIRVVLEVLGMEDYGIYNVVAGIITMFSFLSGAMATATQRYFSFNIGNKAVEKLKKTFSISLLIYLLIAIIVVFFSETIGLWFVYKKLHIPENRIFAAHWIYQVSIISFVFSILATPFMALIIAHEDMTIYAYISIFEVLLKLGIVFILPLIHGDKLIIYSILITCVVFLYTTTYKIICRIKYNECEYKIIYDKELFVELLNYTGWNIFGASVGVVKNQAINILLNQSFNPIVIAARSISFQVNSAVSSFSQNFSTAVRPQIIKLYATNKYEKMNSLINNSCKSTFSLMYVITLPLIIEMATVLKLWLKTPPVYSVIFCRLVLIEALIDSISYPIQTAIQATGKIKLYQSSVGGVLLLNLPMAYIALTLSANPTSVYMISIFLTIVACVVRFILLARLINFSTINFIQKVVYPLLLSSSVSIILSAPLYLVEIKSNILFLARIVLVILISMISFLTFSTTLVEKQRIIQEIIKIGTNSRN